MSNLFSLASYFNPPFLMDTSHAIPELNASIRPPKVFDAIAVYCFIAGMPVGAAVLGLVITIIKTVHHWS